jgi:hypothetical protein
MKYQFTQKAKDKKKETIQKLEKHLDATHWLFHEREQLCQDEVHLLEPLLEIQDEIKTLFATEIPSPHYSMELMTKYYEEWETIYIKHGWEKVKPSFRPIRRPELENLWLPYKKGEKIASYLTETSHISLMDMSKRCFKYSGWTLKLFKDASFSLNLLELHDTLYTHEAFLILIGISPDDIEYRQIVFWMTNYNGDEEEYSETFYDAYPEWKTIERQFKNRIKGVVVAGRTEKWEGLKESENEQWIAPSEIDKQEFIRYVKDQGYIEEANKNHHRDVRKAPYDESFSKMLHKELLAKYLIRDGKHRHEWIWNTTVSNGFNSFNYLGRLLALNMVPMKYWLPLDRNSVSWENLEHYIAGVKNPKNQISMPNNARVIEDIVKKLMEGHDKRPLTEYKDLD